MGDPPGPETNDRGIGTLDGDGMADAGESMSSIATAIAGDQTTRIQENSGNGLDAELLFVQRVVGNSSPDHCRHDLDLRQVVIRDIRIQRILIQDHQVS